MTMVSCAPGRRSRNAVSRTAIGVAPSDVNEYWLRVVVTPMVSAAARTLGAVAGDRALATLGWTGAATRAGGTMVDRFCVVSRTAAFAESGARRCVRREPGNSIGVTTMTSAIRIRANSVRLS